MEQKQVSLLELDGNSNIGLYMFANDKFAIIGEEIPDEKKKAIEEILKVKIYSATILGTSLIGVFTAGNNNILLLPQLYDYELKKFQQIEKEQNIKLIISDEKQNTFGNNICISEDLIFLNSAYNKKFQQTLQKETNLPIYTFKHQEFSCAGALCRANGKDLFISQELQEKDVSQFTDKIKGMGTVNSGSNFISSGIIVNKNGLLIGANSSTIEIQNIVEAFNFL